MSRNVLVLWATVILIVVAGCAKSAPERGSVAPTSNASSAPQPNQAVTDWLARGGCRLLAETEAAPSSTSHEPVLLTVTGHLSAGLHQPVTYTRRDLEALPQVECSVMDRQAEGRQVVFRGVLASTLLDSIGSEPTTRLRATALNDYQVDIPVSDLKTLPVLLATRADGKAMTVAHYGPVRVIYPTTGFDLDKTVYDPRWIWQLSALVIT